MKPVELAVIVAIILALLFIIAILALIILEKEKKREKADFTEIIKANSRLEKLKVYFMGWVVEYDSKSKDNFYRYHDKFTWVSPTWYVFGENLKLIEKVYDEEFVSNCRKWCVKILPLIANKDFSRGIVHKILSDPEVREKAVNQIVEMVLSRGYDGVNIDFENIPPEDRENLTLFMKLLHEKLHPLGKLVTIDVPAKTQPTYSGWSGAYDYKALANYSDLVIIMIYDYHWAGGSPGPISPLDWFNDVLDYALQTIPREKIVAGIPFYGYDWPEGGRGRGVTYAMAIRIANESKAYVHFDSEKGEAYFTYYKDNIKHYVWFQIAKSTELRVKAALSKGIDKVAAWRIGQEDPLTWNVIDKP